MTSSAAWPSWVPSLLSCLTPLYPGCWPSGLSTLQLWFHRCRCKMLPLISARPPSPPLMPLAALAIPPVLHLPSHVFQGDFLNLWFSHPPCRPVRPSSLCSEPTASRKPPFPGWSLMTSQRPKHRVCWIAPPPHDCSATPHTLPVIQTRLHSLLGLWTPSGSPGAGSPKGATSKMLEAPFPLHP